MLLWFLPSQMRRHWPGILLLLLLVPLASGCAMTPKTAQVPAARHRLTVDFTVAGRINPQYYYFIAIDTQGDPAAGPVPVVSAPWGNGWGTGRITHFVEYHLGGYTVYHMRDSTMLLADPLGTPFQYNQPTLPPYNEANVVLDLDTLAANLTQINLNIITTDTITIEPTFTGTKIYDGLGSTGNSFISIPVDVNATYTDAQSLDPEMAGDVPLQPAGGVTVNDLDINGWSVGVQIF